MTKLMKLAATALLSIMVVTGCSSIPLSTMMRLSSFGPEVIATTNPADIRVKFLVPEGYAIDSDNASLVLRATDENDVSSNVIMELDLLHSEQEERSAGLFRGNMSLKADTFRLTKQSVEELFALQQSIHQGGKHHVHFSISAPFAELPPDANEVMFWVDIQLSPDEPYMPLFNRATIKFEET